jgi:hypothetical protein
VCALASGGQLYYGVSAMLICGVTLHSNDGPNYLVCLLWPLMYRPVRPDAAVLVAARHDGYVDMASVKALQVRRLLMSSLMYASCLWHRF